MVEFFFCHSLCFVMEWWNKSSDLASQKKKKKTNLNETENEKSDKSLT